MYLADDGTDMIRQYNLATAFDINTAVFDDDFDHALLQMVLQESNLTELTAEDQRALILKCRHAKENLSIHPGVLLEHTLSNKSALQISISQETFFQLTQDFVQKHMMNFMIIGEISKMILLEHSYLR